MFSPYAQTHLLHLRTVQMVTKITSTARLTRWKSRYHEFSDRVCNETETSLYLVFSNKKFRLKFTTEHRLQHINSRFVPRKVKTASVLIGALQCIYETGMHRNASIARFKSNVRQRFVSPCRCDQLAFEYFPPIRMLFIFYNLGLTVSKREKRRKAARSTFDLRFNSEKFIVTRNIVATR